MEPTSACSATPWRATPTLFARQDEVEAAWAVVEPILEATTPVHDYEPGTWGPAEADALAAEIGGWHSPVAATSRSTA